MLILQQVIDRTEGIPLFVEEFSNVIVESGMLDESDGSESMTHLSVIPATLHDLLLSRLDRMAADQEVIQLAATIGREFNFELLAAACTLPDSELTAELDKLVNAESSFSEARGLKPATSLNTLCCRTPLWSDAVPKKDADVISKSRRCWKHNSTTSPSHNRRCWLNISRKPA